MEDKIYTCADCRLEKPEIDFGYRKASKNKRQPRCKGCSNLRVKRWSKRKPKVEKIPEGQLRLGL